MNDRLVGSPVVRRHPDVVIHADWGKKQNKRWYALARRERSGRYRVSGTRNVVDPLELLSGEGAEECRVVGVDFPIGLPRHFAEEVRITSFVKWLDDLGAPPWDCVAELSEEPSEITFYRPFYPRTSGRKGQHRKAHLLEALGVAETDDLKRICERSTNAECMFWTLGPRQVGRGAIAGWDELVKPARQRLAALWPFDGSLDQLVTTRSVVIAETYPAVYYRTLELGKVTKRTRNGRASCASAIFTAAELLDVDLDDDLTDEIVTGFSSDDRFDALVGLLGMLQVLRDEAEPDPPSSCPEALTIEGWILGTP